MTVKKSIGLAVAAAATLVAAPLAAQPANPYWEGFYGGLNAGGLWGTTSSSLSLGNDAGGRYGVGSGFAGGAQVGYNYLVGPVLLGAELDFQGSTYQSTLTSTTMGSSGYTANHTMPWFSTMRARIGYPVGSVMPYVTGGAVWGRQKLEGTDTPNGYFNVSNNFWTYTFGAGMEGHFTERWSAKLEYLWIGTPDTPLSSPATTSINDRSIGNLVRVGVNYRF